MDKNTQKTEQGNEMPKILPLLDSQRLQEKANEAAMKGAMDTINEFYTGYNSPYKKAIEDSLKSKGLDNNFDLPDILAVINEKLSSEIDLIANTAVAKSFIPLVKRILSREESEIRFSDILKKFIEISGFDREINDYNDYTVEKNDSHPHNALLRDTFYSYKITNGDIGYEIRTYKDKKGTTMVALPYLMDKDRIYTSRSSSGISQTMKISLDGGASLEMPFTKGVLEDEFVAFIARLVIGNNNIILDVEDFSEDMFPEDEHCHCD